MYCLSPICAASMVWVYSGYFNIKDLKLSLICAAALFLISSLINKQSSKTILVAFRDIRRNLSFNRIGVNEAQTQVDLLQIGGTFDQILESDYKEYCAATNKLIALLNNVDDYIAISSKYHTDNISRLNAQDKVDILGEMSNFIKKGRALIKEMEPLLRETKEKYQIILRQLEYFIYCLGLSDDVFSKYFNLLKSINHRVDNSFVSLEKCLKDVANCANEIVTKNKLSVNFGVINVASFAKDTTPIIPSLPTDKASSAPATTMDNYPDEKVRLGHSL
jgi:hypothetical protein